jgi:hypothetical protein
MNANKIEVLFFKKLDKKNGGVSTPPFFLPLALLRGKMGGY